ncbi:ribonuclease H-like domain-containing protein [Tanacetum coccineum]
METKPQLILHPSSTKNVPSANARRNNEKALNILLSAIPDRHLLSFHDATNAKTLWTAIKARFGGNDASKKMQKNLLKQQFETFTIGSREELDSAYERFQNILSMLELYDAKVSLEDANLKFLRSLPSVWHVVATMIRDNPPPGLDDWSFICDFYFYDDLYNNLKVYEHELKGVSNSNSQNIAFLSTEVKGSTLKQSTVEPAHIPKGYTQAASSTVQTAPNCASHSDEIIYAMEEIDIRWQVAMITARIRKFMRKTGRPIDLKPKNGITFDKSKIECFNCQKLGHFARECRFAKYQENRANGRQEKRGRGKEIYEYDLKIRDSKLEEKQKELDQALKERDDFKDKLEKWSNASVLQNEVLNKQRYVSDKSCIGFGVESSSSMDSENTSRNTNSSESSYPNFQKAKGFHSVPPPTGTIIPPRANVSFTGIDELAIRNKVLNQENTKTSQPEIDRNKVIIEDWVDSDDEETVLNTSEIQKKTVSNSENSETSFENRSPSSQNSVGQVSRKTGFGHKGGKLCFVCYSPNHLIKDCNLHERTFKQTQTHKPKGTQGSRDTRPVWNNIQRVNHSNFSRNSKYPHQRRSFIPSAVLTREGLKSTARPRLTRTVPSKSTANVFYQGTARPKVPHAVLSQSTDRPYYPRMDNTRPRTSSFSRTPHRPQRPKKIVKSIWVKKGSTVGTQAVLPQTVKESAMMKSNQTWRPKGAYLDSVNRDNDHTNKTLKQFEYGNPEEDLKDYAIIDSGCSGSMTGDKDKLSDFKEFKGGYVAFGNDSKGGRISGKGTIKTSCLDFEKVSYVEELKFNLLSVSQICDKKHNVLFTDKECLILSPKFKFVDEDLVITVEALERMIKGKQHRASCKKIEDRTVREPLELLHMDLFGPVSVESVNRKKYCLVVTDDCSHKVRPSGGRNRSRINNDVFVSKKGIKREYSIARTPQQNGVAERKNRTLIEAARTMLADSLLPIQFWAEAVNTACYVLNRVVTKRSRLSSCKLLRSENQKGKGPDWMFDLDLLTPSMNYIPVRKENYADSGGQETACNDVEDETTLYIVSRSQTIMQLSMKPSENVLLTEEVPLSSEEQALHDELVNLMHQESLAKLHNDAQRNAFEKEKKRIALEKGKECVDSTFTLSTANTPPQNTDTEEGERLTTTLSDPTLMSPLLPNSIRFISKSDIAKYCWGFKQEEAKDKENPRKSSQALAMKVGEAMQEELLRFKLQELGVICDIIIGSTFFMVKDFEELMQKEFKMSSMGELTFFFGLQVKQTTAGIFLSQDKYVKDIFNKFEFRTIKPASTPIEAHKSLGKDEEGEDVDVLLYRYLKLQPKLGLWYPKDSPFHLEAFSDSDYAGDNHDRRSTSGVCQYFGRRLVSWQCKKQTIVAISSTEAEYVAAASCYAQRLINVVKVHTDENVADLLTKGFDLARFNFLVVTIGMINP